jgi:large subunit ribosomal protein L14e
MSLFQIGRMCVKIAGRDAGKQCVVLSSLKDSTVLVDGETRRRNVNVRHLEPLDKTLDIKADASHSDVAKAFETLGLKVFTTKPKKAAARPRMQRTVKVKTAKPVKKAKSAPAKESKPTVEVKKVQEAN